MRTIALERSVAMIPDGSCVMIGGFMSVGTPERVIDEMVRRKEAHFASNRRMIINYDLTMTPTGPYLQVLSTFDRP